MSLTVLASVQHRTLSESSVKSALLVMLISKQVQFLTEIPKDWVYCLHIDMAPDENWLEADRLRVILETLVGSLAHTGRTPIDICAVKSAEFYSIVVRTTEPGVTIAE